MKSSILQTNTNIVTSALTFLPRELMLLVMDLMNLGSVFSLSRVCKSLLIVGHKMYKTFPDIHNILIDTIRNNHSDLFKWLTPDTNLTLPRAVREYHEQAAHSGSLEILKYLQTQTQFRGGNECFWSAWSCYYAAQNDHLEILKYLHENGCRWDTCVCAYAVENGHFEILKYLHENGCPWSNHICCYAAENGHLEILRYLHENGCPLNSNTCYYAITSGHLEILKYLHENGCHPDERCCVYAAENGHLEILNYLYENGYH